jgi:hypothetical protein
LFARNARHPRQGIGQAVAKVVKNRDLVPGIKQL